MHSERTQVGIVGAGPAGLFLSQMLARHGIESIVLEDRSRAHVEGRIRAGVLEKGTTDLLAEIGAGDRLAREGLVHEGIEIHFRGGRYRVDFPALTGGKRIVVYGQQEVVKDLIAARLADGGAILFEVEEVSLDGLDGERPAIRYREKGGEHAREIACDFVAGCDGFHGICRPSIPEGAAATFERAYPFAWLGILAEAAPASGEVVYTYSERGFSLLSMRSPTVVRQYLQVDPNEDLAAWPDERIWEELEARNALADGSFHVSRGPILQKGITPMRSFVSEPMQFGRLFLAGDSAHIVPPTGAKGMNLAVADVRCLAEALAAFYRSGSRALLDGYSARCLRRVWKVQRFSWWMTTMLHLDLTDTVFDRRRQVAELDYVTGSRAAMAALAENYVGLPFDDAPVLQ